MATGTDAQDNRDRLAHKGPKARRGNRDLKALQVVMGK